MNFDGGSKKIGVVSHSVFMKILVSKDIFWKDVFEWEPKDKQKVPSDEYSFMMKNCEIKALKYEN